MIATISRKRRNTHTGFTNDNENNNFWHQKWSVWNTAFFLPVPLPFLSLSSPFPFLFPVSSSSLLSPPFLFPLLFPFLFPPFSFSFSVPFPFVFLSFSFRFLCPFPFLFLFLSLSFSFSFPFPSLPVLFLFPFPFLAHLNSLIKVWSQRLENR